MRVVLLPLDERPCNRSFPERMSEGNGEAALLLPPRELLGDKKKPADFDLLLYFLKEACRQADALVLSFDMLLYGGIVPSRLHSLKAEELLRRIEAVRALKRDNPNLKIYGFALVMRCPQYSSADEEPDYYEECGREIFLTGQLEHRKRLGKLTEKEYAARRAPLDRATGEHLADYLARREKNRHALLEIARLSKDVLDCLVIPQDDSAPLGYTAMDREALFDAIEREGLPRPLNYPGADEVGCVLLARAVNEGKGCAPAVEVHYASEEGKRSVPIYEDRPLEDTVRSQIEAAGCVLAEKGDIALFLNNRDRMKDISAAEPVYENDCFLEGIAQAVEEGRRVAVADVAYCNGADRAFLASLQKKVSLFRLASYAGWNTSSNSLGTAIAQAVFTLHFGFNETHDRFLAERFLEDACYCAHVRRKVCENYLPALGLDYFHADGQEGEAASIVREELERDSEELFPEVAKAFKLEHCTLPWRRMFEAEITVTKR